MIVMNRTQILSNMIQWMRNHNATITDFNVGSVIRAILNAFASVLSELYYATFVVERSSTVIYAEGDKLDDVVAGRGIKRQESTSSSVLIRYRGTNGTTIPIGHKTSTESGIEFQTILGRDIGDDGSGIVDMSCEAVVPGISGRVKQDTINTIVDNLEGLVSVDNIRSAEGGYDYESDETLRSRTITQISTLSLGTDEAYQAWAREANPDVLRAKPQYGNAAYPDKTALVHLVKSNGGVFISSEIEAIELYIQSKAPLGITIVCVNISWTIIDINAQILPLPGYTGATVRDNIITNQQLRFDYRVYEWGEAVQWADVFTLVNNTLGVDDLSLASFIPSSNVSVGPYSLPLLGTVTLSDF